MEGGKPHTDSQLSEGCGQYTFILKRITDSTTCPSVTVDFSQKNNDTPITLLTPIFHHDQKHYTPAFIAPQDRARYEQEGQHYLEMHLNKTEELAIQKTELFVAKPSKPNSFCCICRVPFDDYLTHVTLPKHQQLMRASTFTQDIKNMCSGFRQEGEQQQKVSKSKASRKIKKRVSGRGKCIQGCSGASLTDITSSPQERKHILV